MIKLKVKLFDCEDEGGDAVATVGFEDGVVKQGVVNKGDATP